MAVVDVVGLMGDVGEVRVEEPWRGWVPDVGIYNGREELVAAIEVVDTNPVDPRKAARFKSEGVEAYVLNVKKFPKGTEQANLAWNPMAMVPIGHPRCGRKQRAVVQTVIDYWYGSCSYHPALAPFIGVRRWDESRTHQYLYGCQIAPRHWSQKALDEVNASCKSPIHGLSGDDLDWGKPMEIMPDAPRKSLSVIDWRDTLALLRVNGRVVDAQGIPLPDIYKQITAPQGMELMSFARMGGQA